MRSCTTTKANPAVRTRKTPPKKARFAKEQARLYEVHGKQNILHDPYYNPNLSLDYEDFRESGDLRNLKNVTL